MVEGSLGMDQIGQERVCLEEMPMSGGGTCKKEGSYGKGLRGDDNTRFKT